MAVKGLIHYALEVPDPAKGEAFYRDFGLQAAEGGGDALRLQAGRGAGGLLLYEGRRSGCIMWRWRHRAITSRQCGRR
jgi:catechol 2,3-dioxygenase-like lactoylglutathione lyase family enzyme